MSSSLPVKNRIPREHTARHGRKRMTEKSSREGRFHFTIHENKLVRPLPDSKREAKCLNRNTGGKNFSEWLFCIKIEILVLIVLITKIVSTYFPHTGA